MTHNHPIRDEERHFVINAVARTVSIPEKDRPVLIQHDHNSEHITFECDRFVEGHDLMLCDKVEIHYKNIQDSRRSVKGVYPVEDLKVSDSDNDKIKFTWIVSLNATTYNGPLWFAVTFSCTDNGDILYRWNTNICKDLFVFEGIDNGEAVEQNYADVLEMWRLDLFGIGDTEEARIRAVGNDVIASIPEEYSDLYSNVNDLNGLLKFTVKTPNLYNIVEFDEAGYYNYVDGLYVNDIPEYGSSGFVEVKENIQYRITHSGYVTFWDTNKQFISGLSGDVKFVTPSGCKYVNCAVLKDQKYDYALVEFGDVNYKSLHSTTNPINDYFTVETNNLCDPQIVGDGFYDLNGEFGHMNDYGSFTMAVTEGESYVKSRGGYVSYFDSRNIWIGSSSVGSNSDFVVPSGAVKMNVAVLLTDPDFWLVRSGDTYYKKLVSEYFPYSLNGLRYGALGDSITYGLGASTCYGKILSDSEKLSFVNYGISGNRIAANDDEANSPMYIRYANMNDDLDIVTVFGGTNDYASQIPIGTNDDTSGSTFKGALNILCEGLLSKYVSKRLGFITPIHRAREDNAIPLIDYVNAIKEICGLYGIPVLDLYNTSTICCVADENSNGLLLDGLHPSDTGHEVLARKITHFIKTL